MDCFPLRTTRRWLRARSIARHVIGRVLLLRRLSHAVRGLGIATVGLGFTTGGVRIRVVGFVLRLIGIVRVTAGLRPRLSRRSLGLTGLAFTVPVLGARVSRRCIAVARMTRSPGGIHIALAGLVSLLGGVGYLLIYAISALVRLGGALAGREPRAEKTALYLSAARLAYPCQRDRSSGRNCSFWQAQNAREFR